MTIPYASSMMPAKNQIDIDARIVLLLYQKIMFSARNTTKTTEAHTMGF